MKPLLLCSSLFLAAAAHANIVNYDISIATSPLIGNSTGPFALGFQLADGSNTGDGNNAAVLSNFRFNGGDPVGLPVLVGSAFGDLSTVVTLTDSTFPAFFIQGFNPGNKLDFHLALTTQMDPGGIPDAFVFAILDNTFAPLPTNAGAGFDAFAQIVISGPNPVAMAYASDTSRSQINLGAASIVVEPEPGTLILGATALAGLFLLKLRTAPSTRTE